MGKEVQKRWRSIRDSYTKAFRQGKCVLPDQCPAGSRRFQYHRQMSFLLRALQNKKPRVTQDKYDSFSEISNSPQHPPPEDIPKFNNDPTDKPLDLKTKPEVVEKLEKDKPGTQDKANQVTIEVIEKPAEMKVDSNAILPGDHFDDDKLFMDSLLPLFKKMDDDTRLLCRIEVLKIIRYALKGHKCFEALKMAEDTFFKSRVNMFAKEEMSDTSKTLESTLSMTTRSADGSRPVRKRQLRSPSPLPVPKKRGPGRPRKIRPPPSDSDEEQLSKKRFPKLKLPPLDVGQKLDVDDSLDNVSSVSQLSTPMFMKMYNLGPSKLAEVPFTSTPTSQNMLSIKREPIDYDTPVY